MTTMKYNDSAKGVNQFTKKVYSDATVTGITLAGATATKVTGFNVTAALTAQIAATDLRIPFKTLVGNLPKEGLILIGTEYIKYSSITWLTLTTGWFNKCMRGQRNPVIDSVTKTYTITTAAIHLVDAVVTLVTGIRDREEIVFYNATGAIMYISTNANLNATYNAIRIPAYSQAVVESSYLDQKGSPRINYYAFSTGGGILNVVEYR